MTSLSERYAEMSEADLRQIADDVKSLTIEAKTALRSEFERRNLSTASVNWAAHLPKPRPRRRTKLVGDAAGEYQEMERGRYDASIHVAIAFVLEAALLSLFAAKGLHTLFPDVKSIGFAMAVGAGLSVLVFWNRWRCVEAYASESCTGILNLSLLLVPFVALVYANYRGIRKLWGR
jgi:hypothetical protein